MIDTPYTYTISLVKIRSSIISLRKADSIFYNPNNIGSIKYSLFELNKTL